MIISLLSDVLMHEEKIRDEKRSEKTGSCASSTSVALLFHPNPNFSPSPAVPSQPPLLFPRAGSAAPQPFLIT